MTRQKRKPRPKKEVCPKGYDSMFEADLHLGKKGRGVWHPPSNPQGILKDWDAHPANPIPYVVHKNYNTDFTKEIAGRTILLEAKGRFWDSAEYSKYKWCRECLPPKYEIVFLFFNPDYPMPGARKRKDGTKLTHGEWATKLGFRWYSRENFPKELM